MQELFRLNLNEKGIIPASPTSQQHFHHHPNTYHVNRDVKRAEPPRTPATKHSPYLQQPTRTLPEKTYGNTFERTGGTAMRTVAFHFKVRTIALLWSILAGRASEMNVPLSLTREQRLMST